MKKKKRKEPDKLKQWMIRKGLLTDRGANTRDVYERLDESYEELLERVALWQESKQSLKELEKQLKAVQDALNVLESVRQGRWMLLPNGRNGWSGT